MSDTAPEVADAVKPPRRYDSPRRREQAAATRTAILDAAERRFEADGFAGTTMAAIAAEAGVAVKTVYVAFETKGGVLRALWHLRLRGDQHDVPVAERPWYRALLAEPDPAEQVRALARQSRQVKERAGRLFTVIRRAALVDADGAELWGRIEEQFRDLLGPVAASLAEKGALRPGLDADHAADVLWALNHPDVWHLLVDERGWAAATWERWFADAVAAQLLRGGAEA